MATYDVGIVGGGPAGSVAACVLARHGAKVFLVDRKRSPEHRIGEIVPAELETFLSALGLAECLVGADHRRSAAVVSVWGADTPSEFNHIASPHGEAWHLDRAAFDRSLLEAASQAGATVETGQADIVADHHGYAVSCGAGPALRSRRLIVAAGRAFRSVALRCRRIWIDQLVAVGATVSVEAHEPRTLVEALPGGWIYSALLPNGRRIIVVMCDSDMVPSRHGERLAWWRATVERSRLVGPLSPKEEPRTLQTHDARTSFLLPEAEGEWLPAGDTRFALDPLSGRGVLRAVEDGVWAAEAVLAAGKLETALLTRRRTVPQLAAFLQERSACYGLERRWPEQPFWQSRAAAWSPGS